MEKYPLEQLALIKQRKLDEAEKILKERKAFLAREEEKLQVVEAERDKVKTHKIAKLTQLRNELDSGSTSDKIQQMKEYLKIVDEELRQKEFKVSEQAKKVAEAAKQVEIARQNLLKKQHDVEKLKIHRKEWEAQMRLELGRKEAIEEDEIGSVRHVRKKSKKQE
jgi:flagellar biosynthesis chaperone FliJ